MEECFPQDPLEPKPYVALQDIGVALNALVCDDENQPLSGSPIDFTRQTLWGQCEPLHGRELNGWASLASMQKHEPVILQLWIDGQFVAEGPADRRRADLARYDTKLAYCGFQFLIPARFLDDKPHRAQVKPKGSCNVERFVNSEQTFCLPLKGAPQKPFALEAYGHGNREEENAPKFSGAASPSAPDVQNRSCHVTKGVKTGQITVDLAYRLGRHVVVAGWSTASMALGLKAGDHELQVEQHAVPRPDVAAHFGLPEDTEWGYVLVAEHTGNEPITLTWKTDASAQEESNSLTILDQQHLTDSDKALLSPALGRLALACEPLSAAWRQFISIAPATEASCAGAKGYIDFALADKNIGQGVVVGWEVHAPGAYVWIEDDSGAVHALDAGHRRFRQDIYDVFANQFGGAVQDAGFVVLISGLKPGAKVFLKACSEEGVHLLMQTTCGELPSDPVAAARWLFGIECPKTDYYRRVECVDEPLISSLIGYRQSMWADLPVRVTRLGEAVGCPQVSIVIPLYGQRDFVEHQLIEFSQDDWLKSNAEIIYVVDDPKLVESFTIEAQALHRLYRLPFTWIWGGVNRGFSGANNLGAEQARGDRLIFLNSDAFPQRPGWARDLIEVLETHPEVGIVGPRLVFSDGGIQHASMQFLRLDELGIWVNHHPYMGLDPALDPAKELTFVPAVTGACIALRKRDFNELGGWDTGYLIGDFEDSDLCLKFRAAGFKIAYLPTVQLTHLERQSFKLLGADDFRQRVTLYNAVRHQKRWRELIETACAQP